MAKKTDITDEIEFWSLIKDVETNKSVMTSTDIKGFPGNCGVV
ncbi:MAG: hypothetical protein V1875_08365 [Candidatus Altiarchaeota archaeon]